jgi:hypothetical protein
MLSPLVVCAVCDAGYGRDANGNCMPCPIGFYKGAPDDTCLPCGAGESTVSTGGQLGSCERELRLDVAVACVDLVVRDNLLQHDMSPVGPTYPPPRPQCEAHTYRS